MTGNVSLTDFFEPYRPGNPKWIYPCFPQAWGQRSSQSVDGDDVMGPVLSPILMVIDAVLTIVGLWIAHGQAQYNRGEQLP